MFEPLQNYRTTYQHHYQSIPPGSYPPKGSRVPQADEPLISQYLRCSLQVNGQRTRSKVWPKTLVGVEEYRDFVKRLECCKKELFKLYFRRPQVDICVIDKMMKDLEKSIYQLSYSPNEYRTLKESLRYLKGSNDKTNMKYYETTYGTYYNRIKEMERFKDVIFRRLSKDDQEQLKEELRKLYRLGVTIYHTSYCVPAVEAAKKKQLHDAPLDRYTLRRI